MPIYDYDCSACGRRFEVIHGLHAEPPASCPLCGSGPVRKAVSAPAVHFKGSGWAKKERRTAAAEKSPSTSEGSDQGTEAASDSAAPSTTTSTTSKPTAETPSKTPSSRSPASTGGD